MDFDANGMLPAGIHAYSIEEFEQQFVTAFPASQTRSIIFKCLGDFIKTILPLCVPCEFWVDGSFVTTKTNPNDADIILFFDYDDMVKLKSILPQLRKTHPHLDMYAAYAVSETNRKKLSPADYNNVINHRNYWRGQFGFPFLTLSIL